MPVILFLFAALLLWPPGVAGQAPKPAALPASTISRLPGDLQDPARRLVTFAPEVLERLSRASDEDLRYQVFTALALKPEAAPLMVAQFDKEPSSKVRVRLVGALRAYWS